MQHPLYKRQKQKLFSFFMSLQSFDEYALLFGYHSDTQYEKSSNCLLRKSRDIQFFWVTSFEQHGIKDHYFTMIRLELGIFNTIFSQLFLVLFSEEGLFGLFQGKISFS